MGRKILLEKADIPGIRDYDVYRHHGGYSNAEKALKEMNPATIAREVTRSGLRGRGEQVFLQD